MKFIQALISVTAIGCVLPAAHSLPAGTKQPARATNRPSLSTPNAEQVQLIEARFQYKSAVQNAKDAETALKQAIDKVDAEDRTLVASRDEWEKSSDRLGLSATAKVKQAKANYIFEKVQSLISAVNFYGADVKFVCE